MGNSFYYNSKFPHLKGHNYNCSAAKMWSVELENTRNLWKILIQSEKISEMLEQTLQYWEIGPLYFPKFPIWNDTPRYHSTNHNSFEFGLIWINLSLLFETGKQWKKFKRNYSNRIWNIFYINQLRTLYFPTGLVKTESRFIVRSIGNGLGRWTMVVAAIGVNVYPFLDFSDLTCHLEDTGIGVFWFHFAAW